MKYEKLRTALIEGTIQVIAREGIDKATTKRIGTCTGVNEVYIYRCFNDKEDLFVQTFLRLDQEFVAAVLHHGRFMVRETYSMAERCKMFFDPVWRFILDEHERAKCYIRYYHSPYFVKYSLEGREERFRPVIDLCSVAFKPESNVWRLLNHILDILFNSAQQVFNGLLPDNEESAQYVFDLIYSSIVPYLLQDDEDTDFSCVGA